MSTAWDPEPITGANSFGGLMAGLQAGYNYVLPSRIVAARPGSTVSSLAEYQAVP